MQTTEQIIELAGQKKEDLSVCLGCRICASVCTVNDLEMDTNPQGILLDLFLGRDIDEDHPIMLYCTNCYRCTSACPWRIRIPEIVLALRESLGTGSSFERAIKGSVSIWGRMYEPYVFLRGLPFLLKDGYIKYLLRWAVYMKNIILSIHLPRKVK